MATLDADDLAAIRAIVADELTGPIAANVTQINGSSASLLSVPVDANVTQVNGSAATLLSQPIDANVVSGGSVTVVPASARVIPRAGSTRVIAYTAETTPVSVTVFGASGEAFDLSGKTLGVYIDTTDGIGIANIESGISVSGDDNNVVTFSLPSSATTRERVLAYSIRDRLAPKTVYVAGLLEIKFAPS